MLGQRDSNTYSSNIVTVPRILNYTSNMLFISLEQRLLVREQLQSSKTNVGCSS